MTVFKCKMCGGTLSVDDGVSVAECEYCGTKQTLPTSNDEVIVNLFNRANNLRLRSEYDKAAEVYEKILEINDSLAEAHWGLVLCKYGVEYVEDPLTKARIPTCHRTQLASILTDAEYLAALKYADTASRELYEQQAQEINKLQKKILEIVKSEKPFDVFICYKETDESGARTKDSVIANEIYHELTGSGLKVFFSAITLEDKLGQEYEPYIFAALTSAKVMLVLGTKPEYFNAVWVKNEWSRYLHLMKSDRQTKRTLIPCFRDMDAYDLPDEFSHLQALDMSGIAFMPDLTRNIHKLIGSPQSSTTAYQNTVNSNLHYEQTVHVAPLVKRAFMLLEDGEFKKADDILETALNNDPENAKAYLGKLMCELKVKTDDELAQKFTFDILQNLNYKKACRFADKDLKNVLLDYPYKYACNLKRLGSYVDAAAAFRQLMNYKDSRGQVAECQALEKDRIYAMGLSKMRSAKYQEAISIFKELGTYRDSAAKINKCHELENQEIYDAGLVRMEAGEYISAANFFMNIQGFKDASEKVKECERLDVERKCQEIYDSGVALMEEKKYAEAKAEFEKIKEFKDAESLSIHCFYEDYMNKKRERRWNFILYGIVLSIVGALICGLIGWIIGFICNVANLFSSIPWDWSICTSFGTNGCIVGVILAIILAFIGAFCD